MKNKHRIARKFLATLATLLTVTTFQAYAAEENFTKEEINILLTYKVFSSVKVRAMILLNFGRMGLIELH